MDASRIKADFLSVADIEREVEKVREKYPSVRRIPVDVLGFAEFDLGLDFDFASIQQIGQEAFLRPDRTGIWFDTQAFKEPALQHRLRFSAAHELGHYFLHERIYGALNFTTVKQWMNFVTDIPVKEYHWIEWQADEFAGQLLIPTFELEPTLKETIVDAASEGFFELGEESVMDFCCRSLQGHFNSSRQALQTRIRKSKFWPPKNPL